MSQLKIIIEFPAEKIESNFQNYLLHCNKIATVSIVAMEPELYKLLYYY